MRCAISASGEAVFTHDAAGWLTAVTAGDPVQEWVYRNGYPSEHTRTDRSDPVGSADISLGRERDGGITGLTRAGTVTWCGYDDGGHPVREFTPAGSRLYSYDVAGELTFSPSRMGPGWSMSMTAWDVGRG